MDISEKFDLILTVSEELGRDGKTDIKCPQCGQGFEMLDAGSAYTIKCKTEDCISEDFRGL